MSNLTDKIENAWKKLLPNISRDYYQRHRKEGDYTEKIPDDICKELQFLGIIEAGEYALAQDYILSQKERWVNDIDEHFTHYVPKTIQGLWPQLIDGFDKAYILSCLADPEGKEKFAGTVFEAVFDRLMFDETYEDDELKEIESYILSKKDKWLQEAKAYHKL